MALTRSQRRNLAKRAVADARRNPGRSIGEPVAFAGDADSSIVLTENPNRGKRHLSANVRDPRTEVTLRPNSGGVGTSGVTQYSARPGYVKRYSAEVVARAGERNWRKGTDVGGVAVDYRGRRQGEKREM